ncbi:hypothetical protein Zmor_019284 [Zophobas morio]|uniref:CLIP domain-containing serine protease n=1 Tax=Zophobas morio TaxID=2755281 RepID=A0AA38M8E4_9CUCU|nr:hypothetical protein Zmor_019284 [Zophobas morio]
MLLKYTLVLAVLIHVTKAVVPCQTPNGEHGQCIPINECPWLYPHYENGSTNGRITEWIRRSHCGFTPTLPKVCCPLSSSDEVPEDTFTFVSSDLLPDKDSCGISVDRKILGGNRTDIDGFPWLVLLEYRDDVGGVVRLNGTGVLINDRYVLTAAHCLKPDLKSVRLGEYNITSDVDCIDTDCALPHRSVKIEEKIPFESYNSSDVSVYHDIALLRLTDKVKYSDFIKPICLPATTDEIYSSHFGENLTVAGWGQNSSIKLKAQILGKSIYECSLKYKNIKLDVGQLCAGDNKSTCVGEGGGPLMVYKRNEFDDVQWYSIGVVSFERSCGVNPGVYTKVAKYMGWIVENLKP